MKTVGAVKPGVATAVQLEREQLVGTHVDGGGRRQDGVPRAGVRMEAGDELAGGGIDRGGPVSRLPVDVIEVAGEVEDAVGAHGHVVDLGGPAGVRDDREVDPGLQRPARGVENGEAARVRDLVAVHVVDLVEDAANPDVARRTAGSSEPPRRSRSRRRRGSRPSRCCRGSSQAGPAPSRPSTGRRRPSRPRALRVERGGGAGVASCVGLLRRSGKLCRTSLPDGGPNEPFRTRPGR